MNKPQLDHADMFICRELTQHRSSLLLERVGPSKVPKAMKDSHEPRHKENSTIYMGSLEGVKQEEACASKGLLSGI